MPAYIRPISLLAAFILFCVAVLLLIRVIRSARAAYYIRHYTHSDHFIPDLLTCAFGGRMTVIRNIYLPRRTGGGDPGALCRIPLALVCRGGVLLISVHRLAGYIENPMRGDWRQFGGNKVIQFQNPFESNRIHVDAVRGVLRTGKTPYPHVTSIVVFTEKGVTFKNRFRRIVTPDGLLDHVRLFMRRRALSREEISRVKKLLRSYTCDR